MLFILYVGCAVKASIELIEAEQKYILAKQYQEVMPFEWHMADQYIKKAREEYATSNLEDAETLAKEVVLWTSKMEEKAKDIDTEEEETAEKVSKELENQDSSKEEAPQ